jgi:hypothetical protein
MLAVNSACNPAPLQFPFLRTPLRIDKHSEAGFSMGRAAKYLDFYDKI